VPQLTTDTLTAAQPGQARTLSIPKSQVTHFILSAGEPATLSTAAAVRMTVFDSSGRAVFVLTAFAGQTVSGDVYLGTGNYQVVFRAATKDDTTLPAMAFTLRGKSLTDPINPMPHDPNDPG